MLDKSVPYFGIYMVRKAAPPPKKVFLPNGFSFSLFQQGDENAWAEIETSVLEFDRQDKARAYFEKNYMPFGAELAKRCLFVETVSGEKVATTTAWRQEIEGENRLWLHWVSVKPKYQGLGLGKAVVGEALRLFRGLDGEQDIWLHTQTWSHKAVGIYEKYGFCLTREEAMYQDKSDNWQKALPILHRLGKCQKENI